ncbi:MAG: alpha-xylosidase [Citromicrobium sp.]|nr:alpha-xylosidase [Citromicrobium sp.]MBD75414.1 alpha-xylosidase [Citromicrobium sp.]MBT46108.1 alpha-xylosidase [Citromicrobium sp.]|tara:strand:+ start:824 stop:3637 length:2814 start_codon:yes stop_codon:yes gene_type:complete
MIMRLVAFATVSLIAAAPALAGEAEVVPHGAIITTDAGQKVRVLAYADGTFRVTVADVLPDAPPTAMVVAEADGSPQVDVDEASVTLTTQQSSARIALADGQLTVRDAEGKLLLDEYARSRRIDPVTLEGQQWFKTRVQFNRGTDEGLYGLGQQQNRQMNYNGEDVELAQHNIATAIPYLLSTRGYGILWDNASITRVGDPDPYEKLALDWNTQYYLGDRLALERSEPVIDYQFLDDQDRWPEEAKADTVAATSGQNTQGNAVQTQRVVWTGSYTPESTGKHKFRLYSSSYVTVYADGKEVLDRWRQNWNPWYHNFELDLTAGKPIDLRVEWEPNQGYIALYHADPLPSEDRHSVSFASEAGKAIDYYVVPGDDMDALVAGYRRLTGEASMMPRWAYGFWQSRQRYQTQDELVDVIQMYRDADIPIDAIVQDWFYWPEDQWGCNCFDPKRFPDPKGMVDAVHDLNGRLMISVWPKFYPDTQNAKELDAKGYLYRRPLEAGQKDWVGAGYANTFYDPYPAEAREIYFNQIATSLVPMGFDAWWMDATEPDWHSNLSIEERARQMYSAATDTPGAAIFNSYGLMQAISVADGLREVQPDQRPFILTRSGFGGIQRASAALWSGDVVARWDDLRDQISAGTNMSLSGIPNWTHDIGGFAVEQRFTDEVPAEMPEFRELYLRWFQFGAFSPLFRSHGEYPYRETPIIAKDDPAMLEGLTYYHRLRYRLLPYIYTLAANAHFDAGTIMRPLVMDFKADRATWEIDDEYLFGPAMLVAPVTEFEARERQVYLPEGADWYDVATGKKLAGGQRITAAAPRERMPLFVRAGSIVPMGPVVQWTGVNPQGPLTVHVFAGADGVFSLYEDQGTDMGFARGEFARIPIAWDDAARRLTIGAREGHFPGMADSREITVVLHTGDEAGEVFEQGEGQTATYRGEKVELAF